MTGISTFQHYLALIALIPCLLVAFTIHITLVPDPHATLPSTFITYRPDSAAYFTYARTYFPESSPTLSV